MLRLRKDSLPKGAWWEVFNDPELNAYEQQLLAANQSLLASKDRLEEARSLARVTSAAFFPQASVDPNASRNRYSGHRPEVLTIGNPLTQSTYEIPFYLNWEPDLFGRIRRNMEASNANLQATAADMYNVNLVLTSELAADYFSLRELDAEYQVVLNSVQIQQKGLQLVEYRHNGGVASGLDLAQQQTVLTSTQAQLYLVQAAARPVRTRDCCADWQPGLNLQRAGQAADGSSGSGSARTSFRLARASSRHRYSRAADGVSRTQRSVWRKRRSIRS